MSQFCRRTFASLALLLASAFLQTACSGRASFVTADEFVETEISVTHEHDGYSEPDLSESDFDHWSLRPLVKPQVPACDDSDWCRNEIDQFVLQSLRDHGLQPQPPAAPATLIRRTSLNLTGLQPDAADVQHLTNDPSPLAYEHQVDALLTSSAYGERQAQFWLDLARFAETDGFEHDKLRPDAWRYRDWVIQAFNRDLPYDQFIQQQIAGDLLHPDNPESRLATHFCVCGPDMPDINLLEERRHTLLNEMTSTVGEVVLGLQLGCAQCHDHKYDPVSQADFYRLRGFFESSVQLKKNVSVVSLRQQQTTNSVSHVMLRGDFRRIGPEIHSGVVRVVNQGRWQLPSSGQHGEENVSAKARGDDRIALARWLTDPHNPLTARVIANRVWQQHFGIGLSESASDFGIMGQEPSHPQLLDWLATWLIDHDWSLKQLHRLIVCSATFRQSSLLPPTADKVHQAHWQRALADDPDCRLLSRYPRQRLQGEVIRDVMLQTAGLLNREAGGPGVRPPLPAELRSTLLKDQWQVTDDVQQHYRRSIYVFARRNLRYPIFEVFDRPLANQSCAVRNISTTAVQALHLLNSEFSLQVATEVSRQIQREDAAGTDRTAAAFQRILRRLPTNEEAELVDRMFAVGIASERSEGNQALNDLCLCLLNCNEFVTVD